MKILQISTFFFLIFSIQIFKSQHLQVVYKLLYDNKESFYHLNINGNNSDFVKIEKDTLDHNNFNLLLVKKMDSLTLNSVQSNLKISCDVEGTTDWIISKTMQKSENSFNLIKANIKYDNKNWDAWFIKDIPVSEGPFIFKNLPGLIYSITDANKKFQITLVSVVNKDVKLYDLTKVHFKKIDIEKFKNYKIEQKQKDDVLVNRMYELLDMKNIQKQQIVLYDPLIEIFSNAHFDSR